MILGIFRRSNIFIDEKVLFPCHYKIREYYSIREKHNKFAILVLKLATTFTVRLAYRHYGNTRLAQFLVNAYMYVLLFFLYQNATIAMVVDDAIYLFIFFIFFFFHFVLRF